MESNDNGKFCSAPCESSNGDSPEKAASSDAVEFPWDDSEGN